MLEPATWTVRPISVHVPLGERRNPLAMVRIAVGPLEMTKAVSRLKKSGLAVRAPMAEGGVPAISAAPEVWAMIESAAVAAVRDDHRRPAPTAPLFAPTNPNFPSNCELLHR